MNLSLKLKRAGEAGSENLPLKSLIDEIDRALDSGAEPKAAFDADGTLWNADLGEAFFEYQIQNRLVELPKDPWKHYHDMKAISAPRAYLWLAQINQGQKIEQVRAWAKACVESNQPLPIFKEQKEIIAHLLQRRVKVSVVTASIAWAVEPAAHLLGLRAEDVIGIRSKVINGFVTADQDGPITYREGKVEGFLHATGSKAPFFVSGNTEGDKPLLEFSSHLRLVVNACDPTNENLTTEKTMAELAQKKNWYLFSRG